MSYSKLRDKIREVYGTQEAFAKALGVDSSTLSAKLNNKARWNHGEVNEVCKLLSIPICKLHEYFFTPKVAITLQD